MRKTTQWSLTLLFVIAFSWQGLTQIYENFDSYNSGDDPTGWTKYQTEADDPGFIVTSDDANSTPNSLYHNDDNIANVSTSWIVAPVYVSTGNDMLSFYLTQAYPSYYDYSGVWYSTTGSDPIANPGDWTEIAEFDNTHPSFNGWVQFSHVFNEPAGTTIYVAFKYTGDWAHEFYIDDFSLDVAPSCASPATPTASPISLTEAILDWNEVGTATAWEIEWGPTGFSPGSGTVVQVTNKPYTLSGLSGGASYDYYVRSDCGGTYSNWVGPTTWSQPIFPNDICTGAMSLTVYPQGGGSGNETPATTNGATDSGQQPSCDTWGTNLDLWYSFTAPSSGRVKVITGGAQGDEIEAAIYDSCGGSELDCQNNSTEKIFTGLTAGNTYILQVWHDDFNAGDFTIVLEELNYTNPTFTLTAVPDCNNNQYSVDVEVTDLGGSSSVTVSDDQGSASQQLTAPGSVTFGPYASGTNVTFTVTSDDDNTYTSSDNIQYYCPPANDDCSGAESLTVYPEGGGSGNETSASTSGATDSGQHPSCDNVGTNLDLWYSFTAPSSGRVKVITGGAQGDEIEAAIYDSCGGSELNCQNNSAEKTFTGLTAGNTYILQVWHDSFNAGDFTIVLEEFTPPANDDCANAIALTVNNTCTPITATNVGATDSGVGTPGCSYYNGGDVWFSVVVPSDGAVTIETSSVSGSSVSDTGMAVYEGSCGSLTEIACDDDSGNGLFSKVDLTGRTAGETLYVRVFEYGNNSFGEFGVCAYNPNQAVSTFNTNDFSFYPNPSSNMISWNANGEVEKIQITNLTGQVVMEVENPVDNSLNIAKLNQGIYLLHVFMDGKEGTYKLIKE